MKLFILITGFGEILIGLVFLLKPSLLPHLKKGSAAALTAARMYGAAAISIGTYAAIVGLHFDMPELRHPFLIVFLVFHSLVALAIIISNFAGEKADTKIAILHSVLALITTYFLF
ncbi:MAG: hypothetical protein P8M17_04890 [Saprospiraceae bacterium]|nr:hypothetical protein [Saprospiraceae bacterium]MDG2418305.1 hypothetical protein [Saprospiraceae bacterium]